MPSGLVLSDLHLFSERSDGAHLFEELQPTIDEVEILILNGDIFDFRWSTLGSAESTLSAARNWLLELIRKQPHLKIHYLLGNHDCTPSFQKILEDLAREFPGFQSHSDQLKIGSRLFLHGDCANHGMTKEKLARYRDSWSNDAPRGPAFRFLYRLADLSGLSLLFHKLYFPRKATVKRLQRFLGKDLEGISACYFGHTHLPFADHRLDKVAYFNTGSGIRGMGFNPQTFELD
jgi:UDP-2,3-diacylglucosamine hydrolase